LIINIKGENVAERKAAFIYSSELEKYNYPPEVPFNTVRAKRVLDILKSNDLLTGDDRSVIPPEPADRLVLKKFHTAHYLNCLHRAGRGRFNIEALNMGIGSPDCPVFKGVYEYAALATGATLVGAEHILKDEIDIAFNPSGGFHHAGPEKTQARKKLPAFAISMTWLLGVLL
jgi:acetoin utilization protein AcuC